MRLTRSQPPSPAAPFDGQIGPAEAPSTIVLGTMDDACTVVERQNVPGTHGEVPNWARALPWPIETLREATAVAARGATGAGERR